jgi:hypothetical protein
MKNMKYIFLLLLLTFGCKKLIEVDTPQNQLTTDKVFDDTSSATAALLNVYAMLNNNLDPNYNKYMGVYTDELNYSGTNPSVTQFATSKLSSTNTTSSTFLGNCYSAIYACNQIIEQVPVSKTIPSSTGNSLMAEAKFIRAYCYLYLTATYGAVPLNLTTDVNQTSKATRTDTATVLNQIVADLISTQSILTVSYPNGENTRANKWAATALLARTYLYKQDWTAAEKQATAVISSNQYSLGPLQSTFLANSNETILSLWTQYGYIADAPSLIPSSGTPQFPVTTNLVNAFEPGDQRLADWVKTITVKSGNASTTYYYPYKYHNRTVNTGSPEYLVLLRLGEEYLVRAEARAEQGNSSGAVQDINIIRERAGLQDLSSSITQAQCLAAIAHEWRVEFCFEDGFRFFNLKRTGQINLVMTAYKPSWSATADLLPIPQNDITSDPFLTQNNGY